MTAAITVLRGPAPDVDTRTWRDLAADTGRRLDVGITLLEVRDAEAFTAAVEEIRGRGDGAVLLPGRHIDRRSVQSAGATLGPHGAIWLDLDATEVPGRTADGQLAVQGRGLGGLTWCLQRLACQARSRVRTVELGGVSNERWAELRVPTSGPPAPVAVLLHGGFWRSMWQLDLMDALATDLVGRGIAAWNLEYRRPDRHGWSATTQDVADGITMLAQADLGIDPTRVALVGHSAGAQLAVRAAADGVAPTAAGLASVVCLAGVMDLAATVARGLGEGAVELALGGTPERLGEVYQQSSPLTRLPVGVPQVVVQGTADDANLLEMNRRYVAAARAAGDQIDVIEQPVDHFAVIDPRSDVWQQVADHLTATLS